MADFSAAVVKVWDALTATLVVDPLLALAWLASALVLAGLIVYVWQRLFGQWT